MRLNNILSALAIYAVLVIIGGIGISIADWQSSQVKHQEEIPDTKRFPEIECVVDQIVEKHPNWHLDEMGDISITELSKKPEKRREKISKFYNLYQSGMEDLEDNNSQFYLIYPSGDVSLVESSIQWDEDTPLPKTVILIFRQVIRTENNEKFTKPLFRISVRVYTFTLDDNDNIPSPLRRGDFNILNILTL